MSNKIDGLVEAEKIVQQIANEYYEKADSTRMYKLRDRWSNNADGATYCLDRIQEELAKARSEE